MRLENCKASDWTEAGANPVGSPCDEGAGHVVAFDAGTGSAGNGPVGMSLLGALERAAQNTVAVGCRNGGCGVCRVRVLSGAYTKGKMSRKFVTVDQERGRIALACRIY